MFDVIPACAEVQIVNRETAEIAVVPKRKKVAIVGFASNTLHLIPWQDPTFEIWGMNQAYQHCLRRADRWFEMHMPEATADVRDPNYLAWLGTSTIPVYMIQTYEQFPTSVRYPIEAVLKLGPRCRAGDYFMSSVAFMMALAALEEFQEVHLYGVNLAIGDEYFYEKPNAEWWLGLLEGRGIKVYIPSASALLKQVKRYGYSIDARPQQSFKVLLNSRIANYRHEAELKSNELHTLIGHLRAEESLLQIVEGLDHGADLVLLPAPPPSTGT